MTKTIKIEERNRGVRAPITPRGDSMAPLMAQRASRPVAKGNMSAGTTQLVLPTAAHALGPLAARTRQWQTCGVSEWVMKTLTRGYRLQFAFQRDIAVTGAGRKCAYLAERNHCSEEQRGCSGGSMRTEPEWLLFKVLSDPEEGRGCTPDSGPAGTKHTHEAVQIQNADTFSADPLCASRRLVYSYRPKRRIFSHPYLPSSQEISQVCLFQGITYEYQLLPFGLSLSPRVFVKCTNVCGAPEGEGYAYSDVQYIDDWLIAAQSPQQTQTHTS